MRTQLYLLDEFITNELIPHTLNHRHFPQERYTKRLNYIKQRKIRFKHAIADLLFIDSDDTITARHVRNAQRNLVSVADQLHAASNNMEKGKLPETTRHLLEETIREIEDSLQQLETTCSTFIDLDSKFPDSRLQVIYEKARAEFYNQKKKFKRHKVEPVLVEILTDYVANFRSRRKISYKDVGYLEKIIRGIGRLQTEPYKEWGIRLWELLGYFNFNKKAVFRHSKERVEAISRSDLPFQEKCQRLLYWLSETEKSEQNSEWSYEPERQLTLKDHVINLLNAEINWLLSNEDMLLRALADKDQYLLMDVTVRQIILWCTVNIRCKRILNFDNVHPVLRIMTGVIRTARTGPISFDSARKKLTDVDEATVKGLHEYLMDQLRVLEEDYGDWL